jgi:hypothetical protein
MFKTLVSWILGKGIRLSYTIRFGGGRRRKFETKK